jgi:hypothetical protein
MSETLRSGIRVPSPRVTVQQIGGAWVVLVDGIEDTEHKSKPLAQAQAKRTREALR